MLSVHRINLKTLLISLAISVGTGLLSGIISMSGMGSFDSVIQPPLAPPAFLFPIVWTILYILMGISSYIVWESDSENKQKALTIYAVQLAVNFFWSIIFFNLENYLLALVWIILLWVLIIIMIYEFSKVSKLSAVLQIPYLLWVTFAIYLTFGIFLLN